MSLMHRFTGSRCRMWCNFKILLSVLGQGGSILQGLERTKITQATFIFKTHSTHRTGNSPSSFHTRKTPKCHLAILTILLQTQQAHSLLTLRMIERTALTGPPQFHGKDEA